MDGELCMREGEGRGLGGHARKDGIFVSEGVSQRFGGLKIGGLPFHGPISEAIVKQTYMKFFNYHILSADSDKLF